MKRKKRWLLPAILVLLLTGAWTWYTRPMTLDRLCPSFAWDDATHVGGFEHIGDIDAPAPVALADTLPADDPQVREIYRQLLTAKFRRDPLTALTALGRGYYTFTYGEAGGIPVLTVFAPDQRIDIQLTEDGQVRLSSSSLTLYLRSMDEALFRDALEFLRGNRWDNAAGPAA